MSALADGFELVLSNSWRASVLILMVLVVRWVARGRVPEQLLFVGWIVVAARLLLPFGVPTAWSPCNLVVPLARAATVAADPVPEAVPGQTRPFDHANEDRSGLSALASSAWDIAAGVWALGVLVLVGARVAAGIDIRRRLRQARLDSHAEGVVRRCAELGQASAVKVVVTDVVSTPALFGLLRPRLLLPVGFVDRLSDEELRFVVLHELGHWRRCDLLVQSLLHGGRILHWFNPLVWMAVRKARSDCELACDEYVLRRQGPEAVWDYGTALLKILNGARGPLQMPLVLGLVEDRRKLAERIRRIVAYRTATARRIIIGLVVLAVLAIAASTHESWARDVVQAAVAALTKATPDGWRRTPYGFEDEFEVGVDPGQRFRGDAASAYVKVLAEGKLAGFDTRGFAQACLADDYRGKRVRFSAWIKTENVRGAAILWFRVDGDRRHGIQWDSMGDRGVRGTTDWQRCSAVLDVPADAISLNYGFSVIRGTGQAWFAGPSLEVVGIDVPSTNTVRSLPELCDNPTCSSSILDEGQLRRSIVNPGFSASSPAL